MGQAAVDLPDPLDAQSTANAAGMDDLLAQLAGDEIDRLLAEAEAETPRRPETPPPPAPPAGRSDTDFEAATPPPNPTAFDGAAAPAPATAASVDPFAADVAGVIGSPWSSATPIAPARSDVRRGTVPVPADPIAAPWTAADVPPAESDPTTFNEQATDLHATVEGVAAHLPAGATSDVTWPPAATANTPTSVFPPGAVEQVLAAEAAGLLGTPPGVPPTDLPPAGSSLSPSEAAFATTAAERSALDAAATAATPTAAAALPYATPGGEGTDAGDPDGLPFYLRPFELMNAPLAACPDWVRDAVGKVAILTLVNALGVLAYVLLFGRD